MKKINVISANDNQKMERFIREKYERKKYSSSAPPALRDFSALGLDGRPQVFLFWQMIPVKTRFSFSKRNLNNHQSHCQNKTHPEMSQQQVKTVILSDYKM